MEPDAHSHDSSDPGEDLQALVLESDARTTRLVDLCADARGWRRLTLKRLPGADVVQVPIYRRGQPLCRCEILECDSDRVQLVIRPDGNGGLQLDGGSRRIRLLRPVERARNEQALLPLPVPGSQTPWDVVLLIDGTARWYEPRKDPQPGATIGIEAVSGLLLADPKRRAHLESLLLAFAEALQSESGGAPLRFAVLAFGDHHIPGINALSLRPDYDLQVPTPDGELRLRPFDKDALRSALAGLKPTPGGDFVDALGDALHRCLDLDWAADARRLLVLFGDSPGYSLLHPIAPGGDAITRRHDVDLHADALHRHQVEILCIYNSPPAEICGPASDSRARKLIVNTKQQYERLASTSEHFVDTAVCDATALATRLVRRRGPLARGTALGYLLSSADEQ